MRMEVECVVGGGIDVVLATRPPNNLPNSFSSTLSSHAPNTRCGRDEPPLVGLGAKKVVTLLSSSLPGVIEYSLFFLLPVLHLLVQFGL